MYLTQLFYQPQATDDDDDGKALVVVDSSEVGSHQHIHRPNEEEQPSQQWTQQRHCGAAEERPTADADHQGGDSIM